MDIITKLGPSRQRAWMHFVLAAAIGVSVGVLVSVYCSAALAALAGWDAGGLVLLATSWLTVTSADANTTHLRAGFEDPGRTAVYVTVLLTSAASVIASIALVRGRHVAIEHRDLLVLCCAACVVISWALTHTAFTLRYAHLYYREDDEGVGGVEFPGGEAPDYLDFAYFAFTVGMCFQVSDVVVSSKQVRQAVLLHACLSFGYNTAIVAFMLNVLFGLSG
jgi:uncharacterized membrane protein